MRLPNAERAVVDLVKLRDYCLNPRHPRGRFKARVFASALGMAAEHAEQLREALMDEVLTADAIPGEADEYGQRYVVDCRVSGPTGQGTVRSAWILRRGEDFPRLVTCYVL